MYFALSITVSMHTIHDIHAFSNNGVEVGLPRSLTFSQAEASMWASCFLLSSVINLRDRDDRLAAAE